MDGEVLFAVQPEQYYAQFLAKEIRPDGRGLREARMPQGRVNVITRSDGSASVSLGNTMAVCATRGEIRTQDEVDASRGRVTISVMVSPGCGMHVRDGDALSFDLTPRIQKLIDDPKVIDLSSLVIKENEASWEINVDIVLISLDGNAMDAAMLCALLALRTTTLPALDLSTEKGNTRYEISTAAKPAVEARRVALRRLPITVSLGFLHSTWIVDPTLVEENIIQSHATLTLVNGQYNWEQRGVCHDAPTELASAVSVKWAKWLESF
eukprot:GEMP01073985.1.p1 GENE.GEMP01073985.1~~GEMP01073985.1.p1  ORF type:complete len:278 (+),score=67.00 GEMP01073985.1:34-834(+)